MQEAAVNVGNIGTVVEILSRSLLELSDLDGEQDEVLEECKREFTPLRISAVIDDAHCSGADTVTITVDQFHAVTVEANRST